MNLYDWFFRQVVAQSVMDQAFNWAETADWDLTKKLMMDPDPGGNKYGGILDGGDMTEQAVPDLTVKVSALTGYGKSGESIVSSALANVDLSQDEYGTSTEVTVGGESRVISVFARFARELTTPAVDGNGLTVYTRRLESMEFFVRMGTSAVSPSAPPLLADALLIGDATRANGQTTIQNTDMSFTRREDWIRLTGVTLSDFVHGTSKSALTEVYSILDTLSAGGATFSFTDDWWNSQAVQGSAPPITTVAEALDAIVYDLAQAASPEGAQYIGKAATTGTPGGYCDYSADSVAAFIVSICGTLAGHINGGAPNHPASTIATVAYQKLKFIKVGNSTPLAGSGDITNDAGGEGTILYNYNIEADYLLINATVDTGWGTEGAGVDDANPFVTAETFIVANPDSVDALMDASALQTVLEQMTVAIAQRPEMHADRTITGEWHFEGLPYSKRGFISHNTGIGYGDPNGAIEQLEKGNWTPDDSAYPMGMENDKAVTGLTNIVDIARAWEFGRNRHCVLVIGDELELGVVYYNPRTGSYTDDYTLNLTNVAGTRLVDVDPTFTPYAVCSNGRQIFVLVADGGGPVHLAASIYCYDATLVSSGAPAGDMKCLWATSVGVLPVGIGTRKTDSRIVANSTYVWALLGGQNCATQDPLVRMDAADGTGVLDDNGDGPAGGGTYYPTGGLAINGDGDVFYTAFDGAVTPEVIPANPDLTSTTLGAWDISGTTTSEVRDLCCAGRFVVCPTQIYSISNALVLMVWDFQLDERNLADVYIPFVDNSYEMSRCSFDGTRIWWTMVDERHVVQNGETRCVASIHPTQLTRYGEKDHPVDWPRFMITKPRVDDFTDITTPGDKAGRVCAWGPGFWYIKQEAEDNVVNFLPFAGLY